MKKAALLLNLGTPDAPETREVRAYLGEFLMDPLVVDIAYVWRWLLVHGVILRTRPKASAALYRKIWTKRGSPLLSHLEDLREKVASELDASWSVECAMRYGKPSIDSVFARMKANGIEEVVVFPLYPQYSLAATKSSIEETLRAARQHLPQAKLRLIPAFYKSPFFIEAFTQVARESLTDFNQDYLLFSFHGLPERQILKTDRSGGKHCLADAHCCDKIVEANQDCYRAQCFATAHAIAGKLGLTREQYGVSFQSRLGRTPWIRPYTDLLLPELLQQGKKKIAVMCPAFVADCLETLEEIAIRAREDFMARGGEDLKLVPSLNSSSLWVKAVSKLLQEPVGAL